MKEFLECFWPEGSGFFVIAEKMSRGMAHRYYQSVGEAVNDLLARAENGNNLYFSPTVYSKAERNQQSAKFMKAFWLDIDCAGDHNGRDYSSQEEGVSAITEFLDKTGLPLPTLISSGRGIHVYWVLQDPVDPQTWSQYAGALKSLCVLHGLKADPARTADSASLLRPVGSYNYKTNPPSQVLRIQQSTEYTLDDLKAIRPQGVSETLGSDIGVLEPDYPESDFEQVCEKCKLMRAIADKRGAVEEPLWRGFLSIAFRCRNGAGIIHELSKGDPRYSFQETQAKAEKTGGPYTCAQLQGLDPDTCRDCPLRGRVTSPIILGCNPTGYEPTLPLDPSTCTDANAVAAHESGGSGRVHSVEGYTVTAKGILKTVGDRTFYITEIPIWVNAVREKATVGGENAESSIRLEWEDLAGRRRLGILNQADVYESRAFTRWLADNNLRACVRGKESISALQDYITKCINEHMRSKSVERYYGTLGWNPDGFVLGDKIVTKAGTYPAAVQVNSNCGRLRAKGSAEVWSEATAVYRDPKLWPGAFAVLCGFGSPLLHLCKFQGAVVSLFGASGYGKTLAGSMALSIYGDPAYLTQAASTTVNAIGVQLSAQKNLPYLLDEVSNIPAYKLADFIYDAVNGRQKEALGQDRVIKQGEGWCLTPFISSNHSVLDMSNQYIQDAHRRRIIEIPFDSCIDGDKATIVANAYQDHCGTVGIPYLEYVINNDKEITARVEEVLGSKLFSRIPSASRFGKWTMACAWVGGEIASKLGFIKFNPIEVLKRAVDVYYRAVTEVVDDTEVARGAITSFLLDNAHAITIWSSAVSDVSLSYNRQVFARFDPAVDTYYIQARLYEETLRNAGLSIRGMAHWQKSVGIVRGPRALAPGFPSTMCYSIPREALGIAVEEVFGKEEGEQ